MRLNPRQRWHEGDSHGLGWDDYGSTCAGVPAYIWWELITLCLEYEGKRPPWEQSFGSSKADYDSYHQRVVEFSQDLLYGLKEAVSDFGRIPTKKKWVKVLRGRQSGGFYEITVVSVHYDAMRSFLTSASLGWYDRHPKGSTPTDRMALIMRVLDMLNESADRRPFNQYTYRDISLRELDSLGRGRRLARARATQRLRQWISKLLPGPRQGRLAALDREVKSHVEFEG